MADPPGPLLEREAEVARLEDAIRRAAAGSGVIVALHGPPGIGKTRLMAVAT